MKQNYSDDFIIVRHYIWYNFVAADCPIRREDLDVEDVVGLICDIGKDWRDKNKTGYLTIPDPPPTRDSVADVKRLLELVAKTESCGALEAAATSATLEKEARALAKKYGACDFWSEP